MAIEEVRPRGAYADNDFRARATLGVALIALALLLPFAIGSLVAGRIAMAIGTFGIVMLLATNALMVRLGLDHQNITLYGLVPAGMLFLTQVSKVNAFVGAVWCYPSILACYCMLAERKAWLANIAILAIGLPAVWLTMPSGVAARVTATLLAVSAFAAILVRVIDSQQRRLGLQVITDSLTGLNNRLPLYDALGEVVRRHASGGVDMALLALDLDHFKKLNDEHGHHVGDAVLSGLGALLLDLLDGEDRAFRVGGEEFLVLLIDCDRVRAGAVASAIQTALASSVVLVEREVTVSIGVALLRDDEDATQWARRADELLYAAKSAGRDHIAIESADTVARSVKSAAPSPVVPDGRAQNADTDDAKVLSDVI